MLFVLKKIIGTLLMPLPLALLLVLIVLALLRKGFNKAAMSILSGLALGLYLLSTQPLAHGLAAPLEYAHPAYQNQQVEYVIVLGGGHHIDDRQPITSLLRSASWVRLSEGIRILRMNQNAKLLLSGYGAGRSLSNAEAMGQVAVSFGVDADRMILESQPRDTAEEAAAWKEIVGDKPFALVTSASHMPRAVRLFEQQGLSPITAPTNYHTSNEPMSWRAWLPHSSNLDLSTKAWHEYLGIAWAWLVS